MTYIESLRLKKDRLYREAFEAEQAYYLELLKEAFPRDEPRR